VNPQTSQLAQLMALIQTLQAQQPGQTPQTMGQAAAKIPGLNQTGAVSPQTLGINQPIPMALPQADPQGQQAPGPVDPFLGGMGAGAGG
jgi:hypothetical protein